MGAPKALLVRDGETALGRIVRVAREAGCDPVVVVVGHHAVRVRAAAAGAHVIENPRPDAGRTGSLKVGLRAAAGADAVLVWPVDHPAVEVATVRHIVDVARAGDAAIVVPARDGRRGHPLLLAAEAMAEVAALADDAPLRDVVRRDPKRVRVADVPDAGVLVNLDTPEAARAAGWRIPPG